MEMPKNIALNSSIFEDERGWAIRVFEEVRHKSGKLGNFHVVSMRPGKIRGNHYHIDAREWLLVFGGQAHLWWREAGEELITKTIVDETKPMMFEIPPNIEHAVLNTSDHDIYLLAFSNSEHPDTHPATLLIK